MTRCYTLRISGMSEADISSWVEERCPQHARCVSLAYMPGLLILVVEVP